ncbi:MAG: dephospho-CoA kinase [Planctomycetota bacterium]
MAGASQKPYVIGIVGGIASGKSLAAKILSDLGAETIDADKIGHEVLEKTSVINLLVTKLGREILVEGSQPAKIDRQRLGGVVFGEEAKSVDNLQQLEAIVHPEIHAEAIRRLRRICERDDAPRAIILDAPLLLEANWQPSCDYIIFLDSPRDLRLERALQRGWTEEDFDAREAAQMSLNRKRSHATHLVRSENEQQLRQELQRLWDELGTVSKSN